MSLLTILYEDNHCLAVAKPPGWLTMGDATGDRTLLDVAREYIKARYHKPGAVFLGVVHRLDRPVSGVVLFARTSKAAARISEQFRTRSIEKTYWAIVMGQSIPESGELRHILSKDRTRNVAVACEEFGGRESILLFKRLAQRAEVAWLEVRPLTGRSHQIRAQLAAMGWPILGDRKYGSRADFAPGAIALHAQGLTFEHPVRHERIALECPPPETWNRFKALGTDGE